MKFTIKSFTFSVNGAGWYYLNDVDLRYEFKPAISAYTEYPTHKKGIMDEPNYIRVEYDAYIYPSTGGPGGGDDDLPQ